MDSVDAIYREFVRQQLSLIDAIARLEGLGYESKDAEGVVCEWADALEPIRNLSE